MKTTVKREILYMEVVLNRVLSIDVKVLKTIFVISSYQVTSSDKISKIIELKTRRFIKTKSLYLFSTFWIKRARARYILITL